MTEDCHDDEDEDDDENNYHFAIITITNDQYKFLTFFLILKFI